MAVIIQNMAPNADPCIYDVRINYERIATFEHHRGDGLATCLRKAAEAVEASGHPNPFADRARSQDREPGSQRGAK